MSAIILCPGIPPPPTPKTFHQLENIYLFFNLFSNLKLFTQTELSLSLSLSLLWENICFSWREKSYNLYARKGNF